NAEEFQQEIDPEPSRVVLERTARAHLHITAQYVGLGAVSAFCLPLLGTTPGIAARVLAGVAGLLLLLHARELPGVVARLAAVVPGAAGLGPVLVDLTLDLPPARRGVVVAVVLVVAGFLTVAARTLPGRRMLPHWGRIADLVHMGSAMAILPLVLAVA